MAGGRGPVDPLALLLRPCWRRRTYCATLQLPVIVLLQQHRAHQGVVLLEQALMGLLLRRSLRLYGRGNQLTSEATAIGVAQLEAQPEPVA